MLMYLTLVSGNCRHSKGSTRICFLAPPADRTWSTRLHTKISPDPTHLVAGQGQNSNNKRHTNNNRNKNMVTPTNSTSNKRWVWSHLQTATGTGVWSHLQITTGIQGVWLHLQITGTEEESGHTYKQQLNRNRRREWPHLHTNNRNSGGEWPHPQTTRCTGMWCWPCTKWCIASADFTEHVMLSLADLINEGKKTVPWQKPQQHLLIFSLVLGLVLVFAGANIKTLFLPTSRHFSHQ